MILDVAFGFLIGVLFVSGLSYWCYIALDKTEDRDTE